MTETTIGWTTLSGANSYFATQRLDSTFWDALNASSGEKDEKSAVLHMAYNRIRFHSGFSVPSSPTTAQTERLSMAQYELAYYLAEHLVDEDRRKGIQAQGVVGAGIVEETYKGEGLNAVPLPPIVMEILDDFKIEPVHFAAIDIDRDEDESVSEDVTDV